MKKLTLIEWMVLFVVITLVGTLAVSIGLGVTGANYPEFLDLYWKLTAQRVIVIHQ